MLSQPWLSTPVLPESLGCGSSANAVLPKRLGLSVPTGRCSPSISVMAESSSTADSYSKSTAMSTATATVTSNATANAIATGKSTAKVVKKVRLFYSSWNDIHPAVSKIQIYSVE